MKLGVGSFIREERVFYPRWRARLKLPETAPALSRQVKLAEPGNMSSPTILFILEKLLRQRGEKASRAARIWTGFGRGSGVVDVKSMTY